MALPTKKTETEGGTLPTWHPNFRDYARLPDAKVVRTAFFINIVMVIITVLLLAYLGRMEYQVDGIREQIADWDVRIQRDRGASDRAVDQYRLFQAEEAKLLEVDAFLKSQPLASDLVLALGKNLPPNIGLNLISMKEEALTLRATVRGSPNQASGYASTYADQLRADAMLSQIFDGVSISNLSRNPLTGRLALEIVMKRKAAAVAGAPKLARP